MRNHARAVPHIAPDAYRLHVVGSETTHTLRLEDLRTLPRVSAIVTLACAGNGRTAFTPPISGGIPWGFGAIATAQWDGVLLRDLLALVGIPAHAEDTAHTDRAAHTEHASQTAHAAHVAFDARDEAPDDERPPYRRSIPLARALLDGTIVADTMNGEPLPPEHGGPVRLIVAGWTANHSMKWLRRITLAHDPDNSHWMTHDYRVPGPTGSLDVLEATAPIAILAAPNDGDRCPRETVLSGIAYGEPAPHTVRIEIDSNHAADTPVSYEDGPYAWGRWMRAITLARGRHRIAVRPVDAAGSVGPMLPTWNERGYRYDGPHVAFVEAE
ncbi:MAG: molybdopterin-dependent oxidoreductase [Candidatus Eremiobacteraeota bacterium]|nr:molybdopterin-dependent oxidoreductase [Candidatus Eremiobacteraeota bacterium]